MNHYINYLSERVNVIASLETWMDDDALQQLRHTATLPGMTYVSGMPDCHPGRGYPVGAAFFAHDRIYPALIGGDIGCGMALWQTELMLSKISLQKLDKNLGNLDTPLDASWQSMITEHLPTKHGFEQALGTIGGGNHFAELQRVDHIDDHEAFEALGLNATQCQLLVHSGSRGLGQSILSQHLAEHSHHGLGADSDAGHAYLVAHDQALRFAEVNRYLIAQRIMDRLATDGRQLLDVHHNMVVPAHIHGGQGWLHRKGATPADQGAVVIPGSRGDYSYVVLPMPSDVSLRSLAHGAGRKWMRSACKDRLSKRYTMAQLSRTKLGSHVICEDKQLMYEEAPEAYKPIDSIIATLVSAGLVRVVARLKPVLTYKTRGACCA